MIYIESGLLDISDLDGRPASDVEPRAMSRALTAQAVRIVTGFGHQEAALTVIDGVSDQGIDAIAVVDGTDPHIYLVQAKWSKNGKAHSDRGAVLELLAGLRLIDDGDFAPFNPRGRALAERAHAEMTRLPVPVTQVVVLMRADRVTDGFTEALANGEKEFNRHGEILDHRVILSPEVWESIRKDLTPPPVNLDVDLFPWFELGSPYPSFQGVMNAGEIARWVENGSDLFNANIRNPLGRTPINNALIATLTDEPANFWYFNNGITVLCDSADRTNQSMRAPHNRPLSLVLRGASVVNGAQTVKSIAEAVHREEAAAEAQVNVRIIVTNGSSQFAKQTTQATNRQNRVEARDFIALEPIQAGIMEEMRAELGLDYSVRRGELEPPADAGCSVVEAACALACAHPDSQYAARIATTLDVLWERGSQGIYDVLFRPQPSVYLLWNAVLVLRAVQSSLHKLRGRFERRGVVLMDHGKYLLAHLVFRKLDADGMDEPDRDLPWSERAVAEVPDLVKQLVPVVATTIDALYGERSQLPVVCSDVVRCREITDQVLHGSPASETAARRYRKSTQQRQRRRPNAVTVLIDKGVLAEGTPLVLSNNFPVETAALESWLAKDARRGRATWVPHRQRPILWAADGKQYSPSGLISHMWELAEWAARPVANQGTTRWMTHEEETLADLARRALDDLEDAEMDIAAGD
ncbi:AIPR family protein [Nocardia takedensis]|uniref:AIPR family protein n=1 Tax=Nocardia takedensis TaxID=259390 RepID=UPI0002F4249F|nr:AIPR family protein [Nocardia takedensis]